MKRIIIPILLVLLGVATVPALAQKKKYTRYLVQFTDKGNNPYSLATPSAYLSQRSIERRTRYGIAFDSTDLPVTPSYLESIRNIPHVTVLNASKWLNQVSIQIDTLHSPAIMAALGDLPFVRSVDSIAARVMSTARESDRKLEEDFTPIAAKEMEVQDNYYNYGQSLPQIRIHNGEFLHNLGLRGQPMIIGLLDAGFTNYRTVTGFDSVRTNGQILDTWDFVSRHASVNEDHTHGTAVFSTIATNLPGQMVGTAPKASFYLYRSEDGATEFPIEEHNWVCAAERVDSAGGDVISSSLGYNQFTNPVYNHTYADLNGNITMAARGADLAVKKGVLVLNAAGNSGNAAWKYLLTPADADSVLAVGAINKDSVIAAFSSWGPSADGQVKPDVASVGWGTILQRSNGSISGVDGTSFAAPNLAGLVTCLWQGFRELNNMAVVNAVRQSGHIASTPDNRVGYGIPDMKKAVMILLKDFATSSATLTNCNATLTWTSKDVESMKYEIERKAPGETEYTKIGERFGTGTTFANQTYSITDDLGNVTPGPVSYRIRQIIDTAAASTVSGYIDTATVDYAASCVITSDRPVDPRNSVLMVVPNPARDIVTLRVTTPVAAQNLQIRITDVSGQVVARQTRSKGPGTAAIQVSVSHLAKGTYYVSVYDKSVLLGTRELVKL